MESNSYSVNGDNNQVVQGKNNQVTQQNRVNTDKGEDITQDRVIELPEETKNKTLNRLTTVADDVKEKEPDKNLIALNVKRGTEIIAEAGKTSEEAKKLWHNIQPILVIISKWLGF